MAGPRPTSVIRGDRFIVRRDEVSDAERLHEAVLDSVEHLRPWMPWASLEPLEFEDRVTLIEDWLERWDAGEEFNFGIFDAERLVGGCGLHRRIGPGALEIGYWTRAGEIGRGVALEATGCLVEAAFSVAALATVEIHHDVANVASGRIPERLGFRLIEEREDPPPRHLPRSASSGYGAWHVRTGSTQSVFGSRLRPASRRSGTGERARRARAAHHGMHRYT